MVAAPDRPDAQETDQCQPRKPRRPHARRSPRRRLTTKADRVDAAAKAVAKSKKFKAKRKTSALDAAPKILGEANTPMTTKELVEAMAKGLEVS